MSVFFLQVKDGVLLNTEMIARIERATNPLDTAIIDVRGKVFIVGAPLSQVARVLGSGGCRVIDVGSTESDFTRAEAKRAAAAQPGTAAV